MHSSADHSSNRVSRVSRIACFTTRTTGTDRAGDADLLADVTGTDRREALGAEQAGPGGQQRLMAGEQGADGVGEPPIGSRSPTTGVRACRAARGAALR